MTGGGDESPTLLVIAGREMKSHDEEFHRDFFCVRRKRRNCLGLTFNSLTESYILWRHLWRCRDCQGSCFADCMLLPK